MCSAIRSVAAPALLAAWFVVAFAAPAFAAEITITDDGFEPDELTVTAGTTVVWRNGTDETHTVIADDGSWDSGPVEPGESFSILLRDTGEERYATEDGQFEGVVVVTEDTAEDEEAEPEEPEAAALPTTGAEPLVLLGVALVLVGSGSLLVRVRS